MPRAGSETWDATRKNGDSNYLCFENGGRGETKKWEGLVGTLAKETRSVNPPLTIGKVMSLAIGSTRGLQRKLLVSSAVVEALDPLLECMCK